MIYTDIESILVPEENGKEIVEEPYTNICLKHIAFTCD